MSDSRRFLLAMWDGGGTVPPELGVARRLVARGHSVRVLGDPTIEGEARAAGCEFTAWTTAPNRKSRDRKDDLIKDYGGGSVLKMMNEYMNEFLGGPAPRWVADTLAELQVRPVDACLLDQFLPAVSIAAEKLGLPAIALSPQIWMVPTPGMPPVGTGFRPANGPFSRLRDALIRRMMRGAFDKALPALNATRAQHGLEAVASTYEQILRPDATYVLTTPAFDFASEHLPKNVHYVGPVLDDPSWAKAFEWPYGEGDARPLVLVSLSSGYQAQVPVLNRIVEALSGLPVRAIVTLGESISLEEVPGRENVKVLASAPHAQLLKQAALLVTHCGHGTTMKGLAAGVPILCVPMGRDQNDNATRVVERGAGLRVSTRASPEILRRAVQTLLEDARYRQGAQRLAQAIQSGEGCIDVVQALEALVATSRARRAA